MPKDYESVRDACIKRKKEKGEITDEDIKQCKKMASIWYYKKHGKPVQHSDASEVGLDEIEIQILSEQLDVFGSFYKQHCWNSEG